MKEKTIIQSPKHSVLKRIGSGIIATLCTVSVIGTELPDITAKAANTLYYNQGGSTLGVNSSAYPIHTYVLTTNKSDTTGSSAVYKLNVNGVVHPISSFCFNFDTQADTAYGADKSTSLNVFPTKVGWNGSISLSNAEKKELIGLVGYYGYPYAEGAYSNTAHTALVGMNPDYFAASQMLVWEIVHGNRSYENFELIPGADMYNQNTAHNESVSAIRWELKKGSTQRPVYEFMANVKGFKDAYAHIESKIKSYIKNIRNRTPSWNNNTVTLKWDHTKSKFVGTFEDSERISNPTWPIESALESISGIDNVDITTSNGVQKITITASKAINTSKTITLNQSTLTPSGNYPASNLTNATYTVHVPNLTQGAQNLGFSTEIPSRSAKITIKTQPNHNFTVKKTFYNAETKRAQITSTVKTTNGSATIQDLVNSKAFTFKIYDKQAKAYIKTSSYIMVGTNATGTTFKDLSISNNIASFKVSLPAGNYRLEEIIDDSKLPNNVYFEEMDPIDFTISSSDTIQNVKNNESIIPEKIGGSVNKLWKDANQQSTGTSNYFDAADKAGLMSKVKFYVKIKADVNNGQGYKYYYIPVVKSGSNYVLPESAIQDGFIKTKAMYSNYENEHITPIVIDDTFKMNNGFKLRNIPNKIIATSTSPAGRKVGDIFTAESAIYVDEIIDGEYSYKWQTTDTIRMVSGARKTITNVENYFLFKTKKVDSLNSKTIVPNAEYTLYQISSNGRATLEIQTSDKDGQLIFNTPLSLDGSYYFTETKAPIGYKLNTTNYYITNGLLRKQAELYTGKLTENILQNDDGTLSKFAQSERNNNTLRISEDGYYLGFGTSQGANLSSQNLQEERMQCPVYIHKTNDLNQPIPNVSFYLRAINVDGITPGVIVGPNGQWSSGSADAYAPSDAKVVKTDANGVGTWNNILAGEYDIIEWKNPNPGYVNKSQSQRVILTYNSDGSATFEEDTFDMTNTFQGATLVIHKKDSDTNALIKKPAKFKVTLAEDYIVNGYVVQEKGTSFEMETVDGVATTYITDEDGNVIPDPNKKMYAGAHYTLEEIEAPEGYERSTKIENIVVNPNSTTELEYVEKEMTIGNSLDTVTLKLHKINKENEPVPGATFEIYAAEDIKTATGEIWKLNGQEIRKNTFIEESPETGNDGYATFINKLPKGYKYRIEEKKVPTNYAPIEPFTFTLNGQELVKEVEKTIIEEDDFPVSISIIKKNSNGTKAIPGATFDLFYNGNAPLTVDGKTYNKNDLIETSGKTNSKGTVTFNFKAPKGTSLYVMEHDVPAGFKKLTTQIPIVISEDYEEETFQHTVYEDEINVKFSKRDATTNAELTGASIEIQNVGGSNDGKVATNAYGEEMKWTSNGTFHLVEAMKPGTYKMVETAAPYGYSITTAITFTVDANNKVTSTDTTIETDADIPVVVMTDKLIPIEFSKKTATNGRLEELKGASIVVRKVNSSGSIGAVATDIDGNQIKWTSDGTVHKVKGMVAGKYAMVETAAPYGYKIATTIKFNIDKYGKVTSSDTTVQYDGDVPLIVMEDKVIVVEFSKRSAVDNSELKNAKIEIRKDSETGDIAKDINGNELKWTSNGTNHVVTGLGKGNYVMVETAAPAGYKIATSIPFSVDANGKVTSSAATVETDGEIPLVVMIDEIAPVEFSKISAATSQEIAGANIEVHENTATGPIAKDLNGNEIKWTSNGTTHTVQGMKAGTYVMVEKSAPYGYKIATNIAFTIDTMGNVTSSDVTVQYDGDIPLIVMEDDIIPVSFSKRSAVDNSELKNAKIEIHKADGTIAKDLAGNEMKWVSNGTNHVINGIGAGSYTMVETAAPDGYKIATSIRFTVNKDGSVTSNDVTVAYDHNVPLIVMVDDVRTVGFSKRSAVDSSELKGAKIEIRDTNDQIVKIDGTELKWTSDGTNHMISKIKPGKYKMVETAAPNGYVIATTIEFTVKEDGSVVSDSATVESSNDIPIIVMVDDVTKVKILKKDSETNQALNGAVFQIKDKATGTVVVSNWTNPVGGNVIEGKLVVGKTYILEEITAPKGYLKSNPKEFTVRQSAEIQTVEMTDKPTLFKVVKLDAETNIAVKGAELALYNSKNQEVARWTTDGTAKEFKGLEFGTYTLKELKAPNGYVTGADMKITVDENTDNITYEYLNKRGIEMPETGGRGTVGLIAIGTIMLLVGSAYFISRKNKKSDEDQ